MYSVVSCAVPVGNVSWMLLLEGRRSNFMLRRGVRQVAHTCNNIHVKYTGVCAQTVNNTDTHKCIECNAAAHRLPTHHNNRIPYAINISVSRSWWWAKYCPKHVQLILQINKSLLHLVGSSLRNWWCTVKQKSSLQRVFNFGVKLRKLPNNQFLLHYVPIVI